MSRRAVKSAAAETAEVLAEEEQEAIVEALEAQASAQSRMWRRCFSGFGVILSFSLVSLRRGRALQATRTSRSALSQRTARSWQAARDARSLTPPGQASAALSHTLQPWQVLWHADFYRIVPGPFVTLADGEQRDCFSRSRSLSDSRSRQESRRPPSQPPRSRSSPQTSAACDTRWRSRSWRACCGLGRSPCCSEREGWRESGRAPSTTACWCCCGCRSAAPLSR